MAKRTYNRRGRQTAKTPVRNDGRGRTQRQKAAQVARDTGSKDRVTRGRGVTRTATGAPRGAQGPASAPQQGPSRRTPTAIGGDTGRRGGPNQPARGGPKTPGTMLRGANTVRNVGLLINLVVTCLHALWQVHNSWAMPTVLSVAANKRHNLQNVVCPTWAVTTKHKKQSFPVQQVLLTSMQHLPKHAAKVKRPSPGVAKAITPA